MKGYELSTDYIQLWALIQEGYRVPALAENVIIEVKYDRFEWWIIEGRACEYGGVTIERFVNTCQMLNLQFIVPNKQ